MFVSVNWLRDFIELPKSFDVAELAKLITIQSAEVESVTDQKKSLENIIVGKVLKLEKHPNADRLTVCLVDSGEEKIDVVCGGSNLKEGMLVALALPGAIVKWHGEETLTIEKSKVRGIESNGMICASTEIGLGECGEREIMDITYLKSKPGTPLADAIGQNDIILEFDNKSLTHRPDLWGHIGMAREISAITGFKFTDKKPAIKVPLAGQLPVVTVKKPELCPRYMAIVIKGVKVKESPDWLKKRLIATGHSVISNIVDVTNYVMEEVGQPLHAFDLKNIDGGIVVRTANKNEKITTLNGEEKKLSENMLVIADEKKTLAIAGVMGGEFSGIHEDTVDLLIESANFDPDSVRKTSIKVGLRTDSVQKFEKSLDPKNCKRALLRTAEIILQLCPGSKMTGPYADVANFQTYEPTVVLNTDRVNKKIGINIGVEEMANILEKLGFEIKNQIKKGTNKLLVKIPTYRATKDVDMEDDLIEEIARMHGYEKIPSTLPELPAKVPELNIHRFDEHEVRAIFAYALNFSEIYNYSFYGLQQIEKYALPLQNHIKLLNTLSENQSHLRTTLVPNLVESLVEARKYEDNPSLFELGRIYIENGSYVPMERKMIAAGMIIKKNENPFFALKSKLEEFFDLFGIEDFEFQMPAKSKNFMHPYQAAEIKYHGKIIGKIFTLHPEMYEEAEERIVLFELDFEAISSSRKKVIKYKEESKFPQIDFDVSILIDKKTSVAALKILMTKSIKENLKNIELFDVYDGEGIEENKKSLTFRITLQSNDKTLSSQDLENAQKTIWTSIEKAGGKIRGKDI